MENRILSDKGVISTVIADECCALRDVAVGVETIEVGFQLGVARVAMIEGIHFGYLKIFIAQIAMT
jgi:hypothetical protein